MSEPRIEALARALHSRPDVCGCDEWPCTDGTSAAYWRNDAADLAKLLSAVGYHVVPKNATREHRRGGARMSRATGSDLPPQVLSAMHEVERVVARHERERLAECLKGNHDWQHWTEVGQFIYVDGPRPGFERCVRCDLRREPDGSLSLPMWRRPNEIDWGADVAPTSVEEVSGPFTAAPTGVAQ